MFFLQAQTIVQNAEISKASDYFPIGIQLLFAIGLVTVMIAGSHFLGPKRQTSDKLQVFESGIEQFGNARQPMAIKYFLVAILFVLFDVEVIFFYPYAINFRDLGWDGFWAVLMFVGFFLAGFIYIIRKGALHWEE
ncbi:MAG: NADH-quinone oxidoreductase subunit A [Chitinophagia bacterium]